MLRLIVLLSVLVAFAYAGNHGWGHGGSNHGHAPHGGWSHAKYHGWANVQAWQTPWAYQYGLNEKGNHYNRYAWAAQEFSKGWHGK